ncbi:MAG: M3 family metallopeptidase [Bacteroidetes bacterium]|nr:M3 family metallopeptidase [Bacteroidota bacterium]
MTNSLISEFDTPYQTPPFHTITNKDFLPAIQFWIQKTELEIDGIANLPVAANFKNTIEALAFAGQKLDVVCKIFFNLNSAETNDELQKLALEITPILTEHAAKISQNEKLFQRIKIVFDEKEKMLLSEEQSILLSETYKGFVRNGALLNSENKEILKKIELDISLNSLEFGQNVLAATNSYYKHIENIEELQGVPENVLQQYATEAKNKGLKGWVITLQYPSYIPAMTYLANRKLREELSLANGRKSFDGDKYDNQNIIKKIVNLKQKKAEILGYESYAQFVLEERMAKSPDKVFSFLNELLTKAKPFADKEISALKNLAKEDGITDLQSYDHAYYAEKLKKSTFDLNDEELKPFFPLEQVEKAVFDLSEKLFGIQFSERTDIDKYHPDVKTYEVSENGSFKAVLFVDYFPREGKRAGAWMTSYNNQFQLLGANHRPHVSIVCNFSKPTDGIPSLLTFQEVTTLFHEFGHALHGMLANTIYPSLSGTSVKWDFVELPSQFLENFCFEKDFLKSFAKHYETGEILADEKIEKLEKSKNFMEGYQTMRQIGFGLLDMAYHTNPGEISSIKDFEDEQLHKTTLYPINPLTSMSATFSHIFQGGYSAGYYSYKWAEVLDADAFSYFQETGVFNPNTAAKFKILLSSGGSKEPLELYKDFCGREPKIESLLERAFGEI